MIKETLFYALKKWHIATLLLCLYVCSGCNDNKSEYPSLAMNYSLKVYVADSSTIRNSDGKINTNLLELFEPIKSSSGDTIFTPNNAVDGSSPSLTDFNDHTTNQKLGLKGFSFNEHNKTEYVSLWNQQLKNMKISDLFKGASSPDAAYFEIQNVTSKLDNDNSYAIVLSVTGSGRDSILNINYTDKIAQMKDSIQVFLSKGNNKQEKYVYVFWKVDSFPIGERIPVDNKHDTLTNPSVSSGIIKKRDKKEDTIPPIPPDPDWDITIKQVKDTMKVNKVANKPDSVKKQ